MKFLANIDLNGNQLLNVVGQQLATDPASPSTGQLWYNTTSNLFRYYNGSATISLYNANTSNTASTLVLRDSSGNFSAGVGTFTSITISGTPTNSTDGATKGYVDAVAQGLAVKPSAAAATTTALPANSYSSGVLTATSNGALTVDGVTLAVGQYVLVKNEATAANNGLYTVTATGSGSAVYVLTRATQMNTGTEVPGSFVFIEGGTTNAATGWVCTNTGTVTLGTTSIAFTQFSGGTSYTFSAPLSASGTTVSLGLAARLVNNSGSLDLASGIASAGTYTSVTVDTYGRVTAGGEISSTSGLITRTAANTYTGRALTGTSNQITVTNGDGVAGNPTVAIATGYVGQTSITTLGTITTGAWQGTAVGVGYGGTGSGTAAGARANLSAAGLYTGTISGNGSTTTFTVTHNLNNQSVCVQVRDSSYNQVMVDNVANGVNTVQLTFAVAPANSTVYNVVVIG